MKISLILNLFLCLIVLSSCVEQEPDPTFSNLYLNRGDIIITSNAADDALSLNSRTLNFKKITSLDRTSERASSSGWSELNKELLLTIDGRDRVIALDPANGSKRDVVVTTQLNGTLRCVAQLPNGDILVCESNNIERFNSQGLRVTAGWPLAVNTPYQILPKNDGSFVLCGGGSTDAIRLYDANGVQVATHSGPGGHDARSCVILKDGRIAVAFNGGSDQIWIFESDLSAGEAIAFNTDLTIMPNPTGIAQLPNGNLIVSDFTFHHLVEISLEGDFIKTFGFTHDVLNISVIPFE